MRDHLGSGMGRPGSWFGQQLRRRSRPQMQKPILCVTPLQGCALVLAAAAVLLASHAAPAGALVVAADGLSPIGICWGRVSHAPMPPMPVVSMLQSNPQISRVKLFNADPVALTALANLGSTVEVMIMVPNQQLQSIAVDDNAADGWVYDNILVSLPTGVNIKYVSVGNEPYLSKIQPSDDYLMLAVSRMQGALDRAGLSPRVKLTVSFNSEILGASSSPPSNGTFVPKWIDEIRNITSIINKTNSFFSVNIYPFFTYKDNPQIPLNFIMFGKDATPVADGNLAYTNILDASYDAVVAALSKIGFPNLEVRIGEIGWPTDGSTVATLALSRQFNQAAVAHLTSGVGTPRRPKAVIPFYLFGLLDEDAKSVRPGPFERRWGLYDQLGQAKFNLDLSGNANPAAPLPTIPGLQSLPRRWCIASQDLTSNPDSADTQVTLQTLLTKICGGDPSQSYDYNDAGDCTPLTSTLSSPGLQCAAASKSAPFPLGFNASYALNAKFQAQGQNFNSCTYGGYGQITYNDPSTSQCTFAIGLDISAIDAYYQPSTQWSWEVLGYLVALIAVLSTFL